MTPNVESGTMVGLLCIFYFVGGCCYAGGSNLDKKYQMVNRRL